MDKILDNNFNGMQYLGVPVTNLPTSIKFYESLGFKLIERKDLQAKNGIINVAMMREFNY